jgi:hypothetical protein
MNRDTHTTHLDWPAIDRFLFGEAWTGSRIRAHLDTLCDEIGPRWSSSPGEARAAEYIDAQFRAAGLDAAAQEEFPLQTWSLGAHSATVVEDQRPIDLRPFHECPPCDVTGPLVDLGYGTPREIEEASETLRGGIGILAMGYEPFTTPIPRANRLRLAAQAGAAALIVVERKDGRRMEYHNVSDWRTLPQGDDPNENGPVHHLAPTVVTSREDGALLRKLARQGRTLHLRVESNFYNATGLNVTGELTGERWPHEHLLLGGHHDTVVGVVGGNDNASGVIGVLETARVLAALRAEMGIAPGRTIRFVTFGAEEQRLQGSFAYAKRYQSSETPPRLFINLDELSTGHMKGVVLAFPHLRRLVQSTLDTMNDSLQCHVMSQLDPDSDHFPFLRAGIDAAHLWRWRFASRHPDAEFHHETGDTADKVNIRELKEYVGLPHRARPVARQPHDAPLRRRTPPPRARPRHPGILGRQSTRYHLAKVRFLYHPFDIIRKGRERLKIGMSCHDHTRKGQRVTTGDECRGKGPGSTMVGARSARRCPRHRKHTRRRGR